MKPRASDGIISPQMSFISSHSSEKSAFRTVEKEVRRRDGGFQVDLPTHTFLQVALPSEGLEDPLLSPYLSPLSLFLHHLLSIFGTGFRLILIFS